MRRWVVVFGAVFGLAGQAAAQEVGQQALPEERAAHEAADQFGELCSAAVEARAKAAGGEMVASQEADCAIVTVEAVLAALGLSGVSKKGDFSVKNNKK